MNCETYEIAIEKKQRGELSHEDAARLDAHLASCNSCRSFHNFVQTMENTMQTHTADALTRLDWAAISEGISRWRHELRSGLWKGVAARLLMMPMCVVLLGDQGLFYAVLSPAVALVAVVLLGRRKQRQLLSELEEAEGSDDELLLVYQTQLDKEIAMKRKDPWTFAILLAVVPIAFLDTSALASVVGVAALMALLLGVGLWSRLITLPRLTRYREALD